MEFDPTTRCLAGVSILGPLHLKTDALPTELRGAPFTLELPAVLRHINVGTAQDSFDILCSVLLTKFGYSNGSIKVYIMIMNVCNYLRVDKSEFIKKEKSQMLISLECLENIINCQ